MRFRGIGMRNLVRQTQVIYWSRATEIHSGIDTVVEYKKPKKVFFSVSTTSGTPEELSAGIVPDYDRYITCFDNNFRNSVMEGDVLWIDKTPELDKSGNLVLDFDDMPTVTPDYTIKRILDTQKGNLARYGIKKIGGIYA